MSQTLQDTMGDSRRLTDSKSIPSTSYDLFVGACGADERAYEGLRKLAGANPPTDAILFDYQERKQGSDEAERLRYGSFDRLSKSIRLVPCSTHDRNCAMREFVTAVNEIKPFKRVALDISVFTKPYFMAVLRALRDTFSCEDLDVFYTEPDSYLRSKWGEYLFSTGQMRLIEIPGYPGEAMERERKLLVIALGFEGDASQFVMDEVQPSVTVPINGFPSYHLRYKDISLLKNRTLLENAQVRGQMRFAPALDPFETYNVIDEICSKRREYSKTISPLGSKPMALGCTLYALHHKEVRLAYPLPAQYSNVTSIDCGYTWLYRIPLLPDGSQEA